MKISFLRQFFLVITVGISVILTLPGCVEEDKPKTAGTSTGARTITTTQATSTRPAQEGIRLDPGLQSATGTPAPDEMKTLIELQAKIPYAVIVPTYLPGGYMLEKELVGSSGPTARDPIGYYSFRYSDPSNPNRVLTFNQSSANARPLSGYYLTETGINNVDYQVYWHKSLDYLPQGDPVRVDSVGDAETFVVVWKGQFTDAAGKPQELFYSMNTGTWTGHGWGDIQDILESLTPLGSVPQ